MSFCHPPTFPDSAGSPSAVSQAPPSMSRLLQPPPLPPGAGGAPGLRTRPRRPLACWSAAARRSPRTAAPSRLQEGHKEESGPHRHHAPARPGPGGTWLVPACEVALGAARPRRPLSHARPGPRRAAMTAGGRLRQRPPRPGPARPSARPARRTPRKYGTRFFCLFSALTSFAVSASLRTTLRQLGFGSVVYFL